MERLRYNGSSRAVRAWLRACLPAGKLPAPATGSGLLAPGYGLLLRLRPEPALWSLRLCASAVAILTGMIGRLTGMVRRRAGMSENDPS